MSNPALPHPPPASDEVRALLLGAAQTAALLDAEPGLLFVVKDELGRYVSFNASLPRRLGRHTALQGQAVRSLWPAELAQRYEQQDEWVARQRRPLLQQLDPILLPEGLPGWCVTNKYPLLDTRGVQRGLLSLSRDIQGLERRPEDVGLIEAVDCMTKHCARRLTVAGLSQLAGLPAPSFARLVRRIFGVGPLEFILQNRVRAAALALRQGGASLAEIASDCGFYDQAQFCRQFRRATGMTPSAYRARGERSPAASALSWAGCSSA